MFVLIAGVNVHNEYYVNRIAGIAGIAGRAVEFINETTRKIDLLNDQERKKCPTYQYIPGSMNVPVARSLKPHTRDVF